MLELNDIQKMHDKAYTSGQPVRQMGSDDLVFYWVTQWDDQLLDTSSLEYRGEFNVLRKAGRQIMADLRSNPVQVDFDPKDPEREDGADFLDGLYRADDRRNSSIEAYDYASQDSVVCGFGAWELYTEYETSRAGDEKQVIRRRFIPEANNTAFCDPNARLLDKSDARYWSLLTPYSIEGYNDLVEELTGEDSDFNPSNFRSPEQSYTFPWFGESEKVYVTNFYHKCKVKDKVLTFRDVFGQLQKYRESEINSIMDELIDSGYEIVGEKDVERWEVRKYIASGAEILNGEMNEETGEREGEVIAGEFIPVVPVYGERSFVEGEEYYSGVTRLAKDPQRLRNFQMSYLADIVSRSPRPKPIYFPEQLQGFEDMHSLSGAENNFPYLLQQRLDVNGEALPLGPIGTSPEQTVPQALMASIQLTKDAVSDVADPGLPQDIADPDMSGKAIHALQARVDKQSYIYQHNMKFAKRYDGLVYASMSAVVYDAPRQAQIVLPDGTKKQVDVMEAVMNESGEMVVLNDLTNAEFEVHSDIGPSYDTQKEQTREQIGAMIQGMDPADPLRQMLTLKQLELMDGVNVKDVREHVRKQMIASGFKEPETDEEKEAVAQQQQAQQQPDPAMVIAQAEMAKGQAEQMNAQTKQMSSQIDMMNAETKRIEAMVKAQEAGVKIEGMQIDNVGKVLDNQGKVTDNQGKQLSNMQTVIGAVQ